MAWANYVMICRLCMQHDGVLVGIFNDHMNKGTDRSILKKIVDFTALEVMQHIYVYAQVYSIAQLLINIILYHAL